MKKTLCVLVACFLTVAMMATARDFEIAEPHYDVDIIELLPTSQADSYTLKVRGAEVFFSQDYNAQDIPTLTLFDDRGQLLPDGLYRYELTANQATQTSKRRASDAEVAPRHAANRSQSGSFRILAGMIVDPNLVETHIGKTDDDSDTGRDQVIADDLIVDGSACVGFDCVNGEVFGFDTLRLKENNLRLHFEDTSAAGGFPTTDWRIIANDSANGGASYLGIEDASASRRIATFEGNAPAHSLYVDDGGRVGFGTSIPSTDLHVKDGDSPTLRLEQDGSSGFAPQTWDIAGNETNFFVRDATNGSTLPLRIRPGAPSSSIFIDPDGDVGFKTASPDEALHLFSNSGNANMLLEDTQQTADLDTMMEYKNHGPVQFQMTISDPANLAAWVFKTGYSDFVIKENATNNKAASVVFAEDGAVTFKGSTGTDSATDVLMELDNAGNLTTMGTVNGVSDVNLKENLGIVDPMSILAKVSDLPIARWTYENDSCEAVHMGPMAQDFHERFQLGANDTSIALIDGNGVALAAIQALNQLVEEKDARISDLETRLAALEAKLQD